MSRADLADPITTEIIRSAFVAITDEMKTNLMRTAHNPVIYEALDYTVGLFDATGDTLSIGLGLPSFIGGLADSIRAKLAFYGEDGFEPNDILLTNDPYIMGSHLNHLVFTQPIFDFGKEASRFRVDDGALAGYRRNALGNDDRHLFGGAAASHLQDLQKRKTGPRTYEHHSGQRPAAGQRDG